MLGALLMCKVYYLQTLYLLSSSVQYWYFHFFYWQCLGAYVILGLYIGSLLLRILYMMESCKVLYKVGQPCLHA